MTEIVRTEDVLGGDPRIEGRRISVLQIADMVRESDHSPEYVADQLDLTLAEVYTALAYYYGHPEEMDAVKERHRDLERELDAVADDPAALRQ
jgi:uncharacterized protein (DUF433 family)